jgi:hypothetical protein
MTVLINNGYQLEEGTNVFEFQKHFTRTLSKALFEKKGIYIGKETVFQLDSNLILSSTEEKITPYAAVVTVLDEILKGGYAEDNARAHVFSDPTLTHDLILFFGSKDMQARFELLGNMTNLFYWDEQEKPADIEPEEWNARRSIWEKVVDFQRPVVSQGLQMVALPTSNSVPTIHNLFEYFQEKHLPSSEERIARLVDEILGREYMRTTDYSSTLDPNSFVRYVRNPEKRAETFEQISPFITDVSYTDIMDSIKTTYNSLL